MTPKPLPPHSPKLRSARYHAYVHGPRNERGARPMIAEGRFVTHAGAKAWADEIYPDAPWVGITLYAARTGWRPQSAGTRKDGKWVGA